MATDTVLAARNLTKVFRSPARSGARTAGELVVLNGLNLEVARGELLAVTGASGAGKSTLLYLLAGLEEPTRGEVLFDGRPLASLSADERAEHRNRRLGFVWQLSNLLPDFTARENVMLPRLCRGERPAEAARTADRWLGEVALADRAGHLAGELSGGEQQRAALARALVTSPAVLLADEPTGNLDAAAGDSIFGLLLDLHRAHGLTSVLATHNLELAGRCDRVLHLERGQLLAAARRTS
jgi:lipoprotein-releasing system ATP-binding protein